MRSHVLISILPLILALSFLWIPAHAAGGTYFEFAPDDSTPLTVSFVQTPSQPFYPPNDNVGGIDLWIDNAGSAGTASFGLRDSANNLLTSTTVTIPTINPKYGGTKFHIDFPTQVQVSNSELYKIRIVSSMPNIRLYNSSQFQILQHNGVSYPYYMVEPALLGSTEQNFAFKFALAEVTETIPPIIANATTTPVSPTSERITFNANEPVDFRVNYAPVGSGSVQSTNFSGSYTLCLSGVQTCTMLFSVEPGTTYNFDLLVKDEWGNQATHSGTFISAAGPVPPPTGGDNPPPPPPTGGDNPPPPPPTGGDNNPPPPPPPTGGDNPPPPPPTPPGSGGQSGGSGTPPPPQGGSNGSGSIAIEPPPPGENSDSSIIISWDVPAGIIADQFRVRIFDENNNFIEERIVSGSTRRIILEKLGPGKYLVYVYAEHDGILTQIGQPIPFAINTQKAPTIFTPQKIAIVGGIVVIGIGILATALFIRRSKKEIESLPPSRSKSIWDKSGT
jgi:hypothetical protein